MLPFMTTLRKPLIAAIAAFISVVLETSKAVRAAAKLAAAATGVIAAETCVDGAAVSAIDQAANVPAPNTPLVGTVTVNVVPL